MELVKVILLNILKLGWDIFEFILDLPYNYEREMAFVGLALIVFVLICAVIFVIEDKKNK